MRLACRFYRFIVVFKNAGKKDTDTVTRKPADFIPPVPNNVMGAGYVVMCCILLAATTLIARALGPQIAGRRHYIQFR